MTKFYNKLFTNIFYILFFVLIINTSYSQNTNNWNSNEYNKNIKWNCASGDCLNGKGVGTYSDTNGRSIKYVGSWKNGLRHGDGKQERNHNTFTGIVGHTQMAEGFFENDIFQKGKIIYSAGITFYWSKGKTEKFLIEGTSAKKFGVSKIELKYETIDLNDTFKMYNLTSKSKGYLKPNDSVNTKNLSINGFFLKNCNSKLFSSDNKLLLDNDTFKNINNRPTFFISLLPYINSENSIYFEHWIYNEFDEKSYNDHIRSNLPGTPLRGLYIHDIINFNDYKYSYNPFDPVKNAFSKNNIITVDLKKKTITNLLTNKSYWIFKCE